MKFQFYLIYKIMEFYKLLLMINLFPKLTKKSPYFVQHYGNKSHYNVQHYSNVMQITVTNHTNIRFSSLVSFVL